MTCGPSPALTATTVEMMSSGIAKILEPAHHIWKEVGLGGGAEVNVMGRNHRTGGTWPPQGCLV